MSGPELPSAGAMQQGTSTGPYDYNYNAPPAAGPYDQAAAGGYPANAYGMPPAAPAGYPTDPGAGYPAPDDPAAAGYAAAGYGDYAPPNYGAPGSYGAPDNYGAPSNYGAQAGAVAPQTGPYNESYAQQPPANPNAPNAAAMPQNAAVAPYSRGAVNNDPYGGSGQVVTNPYATGTATPSTASAPTGNYPATSQTAGTYGTTNTNPGGSYQMADATGTPNSGTSTPSPEQSTANQYSAATGSDAATASSATGYQPGSTGYKPGQTGYSPPGSTPYEMPDTTNVAEIERRDPYYRPGSTSDYLPGGSAPAGSTDRYGVPSTATAPGWPAGY